MNDTSATIFGFGRFGKLFASLLKDHLELVIYDESPDALAEASKSGFKTAALEAALKNHILIYCVPISLFEEVVSSHVSLLQNSDQKDEEKIFVDVLSVKLHAEKVFKKSLSAPYQALLTHPMFGPESVKATGIENQPIIIDKFTLSEKNYTFFKDIFEKKLPLTVIELSPDEHDKHAARSQGVAHFIGRVLGEIGIEPTPIDSLGAKKLLEVKNQLSNDNWQLFVDLQTYNPYTLPMRIALGEAQNKIYDALLPNRIYKDELVVGIQGGRGSFNEEAALYYLKRQGVEKFRLVYLHRTEKVLRALHEGEVDRGQFATHNSLAGIVTETVEAMSRYNFSIVEEYAIKISHCLMVHPDVTLSDVDTIMSHPHALKQCVNNLNQKYPKLKTSSGDGELMDHAKVAELLMKGELPKTIATLGSPKLAEIFGLKIVEDNLQDLTENYTSFLFVERR